MKDAASAEDLDRYYSLNLQFHQCLVEASDNRRLQEIYQRLLNLLPTPYSERVLSFRLNDARLVRAI
jgi:DNA-binding GntR family transcriptional regulator